MTPLSIEIHFPESRSQNYHEVVKNARLFTGFSEKPNILKISGIEEVFGRWESFSIVLNYSVKWAGTTVYLNGKALLPYNNAMFYYLQSIKTCYHNYCEAFDKAGFCAQFDWGCSRMNYYLKSIAGYGNKWYKEGAFSEGKWVIDKGKLLSVMGEEARMKLAEYCPAFKIENIEKKVRLLPGSITIDGNWEVEYEPVLTESGIRQVPIGISFIEQDPEELPTKGLMPTVSFPVQKNDQVDQEVIDLSKIDFEMLSDEEINILLEKYREGKITGKPPRWEDVPF
jgi:hypothetical protein